MVIQSLSKLVDGFANIKCSTLAGHQIDYTLGTTICPKSRIKHFPIQECETGTHGHQGHKKAQ